VGIIETQYDLEKDLTDVKAMGKMRADDFHDWTDQYYRGTVTKIFLVGYRSGRPVGT
jgi:hypothetical protein